MSGFGCILVKKRGVLFLQSKVHTRPLVLMRVLLMHLWWEPVRETNLSMLRVSHIWVVLGPFCHQKNWYNLRYILSCIKLYIKLCKKTLGKSNFPRGVLHNLRYNFEVLCLSCDQNQVTVEESGSQKKTLFFSACMMGAGDMGRDCSPSPVHLAPSSSTQHSAPSKKKKIFF